MRALLMLTLAVVAATASVRVASAEPEQEAVPVLPPARGTQLLRADAAWRWQVVSVPRIARQIGALAMSGVDVAAGRAPAPVAVLGIAVPAPAAWPYDLDAGDHRTTIGKPGPDERIAAAFGVATFQLVPADQSLEMLELRLRFRDGVAVWLNGIEVARKALPRGSTTALSLRPRGPEWETFYIPAAPGLLRLGDNTLAIEVHPSGHRDAPMLAADLIGRHDRGIVRGPLLVDATQTTATIAVDTDPNVDAILEWGMGDASDRRLTSPAGRHHRFALTGLAANTRFGYRVIAGSSRTPRFTFHTMPPPGAVIRIGVYGDIRGGHAVHRRLVDQMLGEGLDLVAVTGDLVGRGTDDGDWQRFYAITTDLLAQVPYYPAIGNHDLGWIGADPTKSEQLFALPPSPSGRPAGMYWYSRDVGDIHLVFLDSNNYERGEQEVWLEADLAAARKRKVRAILAFTHDGPYARGYHGGNTLARARYAPILVKHRVDMVLSGHDHIYQRGEHAGLRYVVTGGGGAPLYNFRCGVPNRPKCAVEDGMVTVAREHHYIVFVINRDLEMCTRKVDGTLLEKCVRFPLGR